MFNKLQAMNASEGEGRNGFQKVLTNMPNLQTALCFIASESRRDEHEGKLKSYPQCSNCRGGKSFEFTAVRVGFRISIDEFILMTQRLRGGGCLCRRKMFNNRNAI